MKAALAFAFGAIAHATKEFPLIDSLQEGPLTCVGSFQMTKVENSHGYGENRTTTTTGNFSVSSDHSQELHFGEARCSGKAKTDFHILQTKSPVSHYEPGSMEVHLRQVLLAQDNWATGYQFAKVEPPMPYGPPLCDMHDGPMPCEPATLFDSMMPTYSETVDHDGTSFDLFVKEGGDEYSGGTANFFFKADTSVLVRMEVHSHIEDEVVTHIAVDFSTFDVESAIPDSTWTVPLDELACPADGSHHGGPYATMLNEWTKDVHAAHGQPARLYQLLRAAVMAVETKPKSEALVEESADAHGSRVHVLAASVLVLPMAFLAVVAGFRRRRPAAAEAPLLA